MPPIQPIWNQNTPTGLPSARILTGSMALPGAQWVGFNLRFGVKVSMLWAVESGLVPVDGGSNRFKSLGKLAGRVKPPKVMQITLTDPERI
jgi:hypothetical protein